MTGMETITAIFSALQKSIRGSDPDAAVYYLARLLEAGGPFCLLPPLPVIAAEDVGVGLSTGDFHCQHVDAALQLAAGGAAAAGRSGGADGHGTKSILPIMPSLPPWRMYARARTGDIPRHLKMCMPILLAQNAALATAIPMIFRTTM